MEPRAMKPSVKQGRAVGRVTVRMLSAVAMLVAVTVAGLATLAPTPARAVVEIDVTQGNIEPLPIAIPTFTGQGAMPTWRRRSRR